MEEKARRPWWKRKRWWTAALLWLVLPPVGYPLVLGPLGYCTNRQWVPHGWLETGADPVFWAMGRAPFLMRYHGEFVAYLNWWLKLAAEHRAAAD